MSPLPDDPVQELQPVLQASFTFVARDTANKAVRVPRLQPQTPFEISMYERGKELQEQRKAARSKSTATHPPQPHELAAVHALFMEATKRSKSDWRTGEVELLQPAHTPLALAHSGSASSITAATTTSSVGSPPAACAPPPLPRALFMADTRATSVHITQPQERNLHGKTFGGSLMRRAFEVAWACAWEATGVVPKFLALDDIFFLHPVEVGSILRFEAQVDYSMGPPSKTFAVSVKAIVRPAIGAEYALGEEKVTNTFHFTFYCDQPASLPKVYPRTYEDAMKWIDAARRHEAGRLLAERRKAEGGIRPRFTLA